MFSFGYNFFIFECKNNLDPEWEEYVFFNKLVPIENEFYGEIRKFGNEN